MKLLKKLDDFFNWLLGPISFNKKNLRLIITALVIGIVGQTVSAQIARILDGARDNRGRNQPVELIRRPRVSRAGRKGFRENGSWYDDDHIFKLDA